MTKKKFRECGVLRNSPLAGALIILIALSVLTGLGVKLEFFGSMERLVSSHHFGGQEALASTNDFQEALVETSHTDTMIVQDASALPGESFWLTIKIVNTVDIYGWQAMLLYNKTIIYPDTIVFVDEGVSPPETSWHCPVDQGSRVEYVGEDCWLVWGASLWNRHLDTLRCTGFIDFVTDECLDVPPIAPGSGPVMRLKFLVSPSATLGATTTIRFGLFDPTTGDPANNFVDLSGSFVPMTRSGTFTVGEPGPGENHCPVFTAPLAASFSVNQGATLEFDVTATDEDGDTITLSLDPLDLAGRTTWDFNTIKGKGFVTQKFSYTPGFDEPPGFKNIRFIAVDDSGCATSKYVTIEVVETEQDLLMASILQGGVPGSAERMVPFMITNTVDIYGFQFTFRWDHTKLVVDSIVRTSVIDGFSMYTNLGDSAGKATVLVFGLSGQKISAGLDTVVYPAFSVMEDAAPGGVDILLENAREAINPGYPSQPLGVVNGKFMIDMFGDANLDQMVDVGDVVSLVAYINDDITFTSRQESAADVNRDSGVDIGDLVAMINIIMGTWMGPSPPMYPGPMAFVRLDYQDLQAGSSGDVKVMADLEVPVAGAQLQINYDPDEILFQTPRLSERSDHFLMEYRDDGKGRLTVLLYNMSNDPIPVGEGNILSLPVILSPVAGDDLKIELKEVVLADQKAALIPVGDQIHTVPVAFELHQNYPNPFNPSTTIKFTLPSKQEGQAVWPTTLKIYNVLGKVVRTLVDEPVTPGVHHQVWDGRDDRGNQVASGIYFYRLRSGNFTDTKKMVLMK